MSELEKGLKEQLESVINENQKLLEKHFQQDSKIVKLIEDNEYYKNRLQQKENIIKEVREYIDKNKASLPMGRDEFTCAMRYSDPVVLAHKVLEILNKGE